MKNLCRLFFTRTIITNFPSGLLWLKAETPRLLSHRCGVRGAAETPHLDPALGWGSVELILCCILMRHMLQQINKKDCRCSCRRCGLSVMLNLLLRRRMQRAGFGWAASISRWTASFPLQLDELRHTNNSPASWAPSLWSASPNATIWLKLTPFSHDGVCCWLHFQRCEKLWGFCLWRGSPADRRHLSCVSSAVFYIFFPPETLFCWVYRSFLITDGGYSVTSNKRRVMVCQRVCVVLDESEYFLVVLFLQRCCYVFISCLLSWKRLGGGASSS